MNQRDRLAVLRLFREQAKRTDKDFLEGFLDGRIRRWPVGGFGCCQISDESCAFIKSIATAERRLRKRAKPD